MLDRHIKIELRFKILDKAKMSFLIYICAKRKFNELKAKYPEISKELFRNKDEDEDEDKADEVYEIEDMLENAYHELWDLAAITMKSGIRLIEAKVILQDAKEYDLTFNGQDFKSEFGSY